MIKNKNWFQLRPMYTFIRKQAENEKFLKYLEIGVTFLLIAFFLFSAIIPTITAISSLLGEINSKETQISKMSTKISNLILAQENYVSLQDKYDLIEEAFPSSPGYYSGAVNLATIFNDSSLNLNQINFQINKDDNTPDYFDTYQINVRGQGSYSSVLSLVQKLLDNRRLIKTSSLQLSQPTSDADTGSTNIIINYSGKLYFLVNN